MAYSKKSFNNKSSSFKSYFKFKKHKYDVKYSPQISRKKLIKEITKATVVVLRSGVQLDKDIISKTNNLKFIIRAGSGLDNIDIKEAKKKYKSI